MSARGASFAGLLAASYAAVTGDPLVPEGMPGTEAAAWLYEAVSADNPVTAADLVPCAG